LGAQIELVRYNRTYGAPYPTYYTTRLVDLVGDRYHNDVVRFGYRFDAELLPPFAAHPG
jgi:hypothetical protein